MPQVVAGALVSGFVGGLTYTATAGSIFSAAAWSFSKAAFLKAFATSLVLGAASMALADKPRASGVGGGRSQYVKQPLAPREVAYGNARTGGVLTYAEVTNDKQYLHLIVALAGHEVEDIESFYINDTLVNLVAEDETDDDGLTRYVSSQDVDSEPDYKYDGLIRVKKHLGSDDQVADADLVSESDGLWTNAHRLRGVTYLYVRMTYNQEAFGGGIPRFSCVVKGKKLYDPRLNSGAGGYTTTASSNPALVIRDYLTNTDYGLGAADSEIDDDSFSQAATDCEDTITIQGGSEDLFSTNGLLSSAATPKSNIEQLLTSCGGTLTYTNGKWRLIVAVYQTPSISLNEDDSRGSLQLVTKASRRDNFNGVKGTFTSVDDGYQPTDYPAVESSTFLAEDNNIESFLDLQLPYTQSPAAAQRLAKIALYRQREQITVSGTFNLKPFDVSVGDTIYLNNERYGWSNKVFEVFGWTLSTDPSNMGVDLQLREVSSAAFDWSLQDEKLLSRNNTNLQDPFFVQPCGLTLSSELRAFNQDIVAFLIADTSSSDNSVVEFEVQAKKSSDTEWINAGRAFGSRFEFPKVEDDVSYDVRARAINSLNAKSAYTTATTVITAKSAPPSDVSNFKVNIAGTLAYLSWDAVPDLDLSHYIIRHSSVTSGAEYSNAQTLAKKVSRPATTVVVPAKTGTYFIKAVDKTGNTSENASNSVAIINNVGTANIVETVTESPTWTGTKTNCEVLSGDLVISANNTEATYYFADEVDLGDKYQARVFYDITVERYDRSNLFDSAGGNFDSRAGLFDGDADFDDIDTIIEIRWTDDDPSSSPTWSDWREFAIGEFAARAFQFRLKLFGDNENVSPQVTSLSVTVDMPDRVLADADIASGTSSKVITFSPAFKSLQGVGIAAQNLSSGDYYEITSKSESGFTITFKNSSDSVVNRTFDYVARGYGEVI